MTIFLLNYGLITWFEEHKQTLELLYGFMDWQRRDQRKVPTATIAFETGIPFLIRVASIWHHDAG